MDTIDVRNLTAPRDIAVEWTEAGGTDLYIKRHEDALMHSAIELGEDLAGAAASLARDLTLAGMAQVLKQRGLQPMTIMSQHHLDFSDRVEDLGHEGYDGGEAAYAYISGDYDENDIDMWVLSTAYNIATDYLTTNLQGNHEH